MDPPVLMSVQLPVRPVVDQYRSTCGTLPFVVQLIAAWGFVISPVVILRTPAGLPLCVGAATAKLPMILKGSETAGVVPLSVSTSLMRMRAVGETLFATSQVLTNVVPTMEAAIGGSIQFSPSSIEYSILRPAIVPFIVQRMSWSTPTGQRSCAGLLSGSSMKISPAILTNCEVVVALASPESLILRYTLLEILSGITQLKLLMLGTAAASPPDCFCMKL